MTNIQTGWWTLNTEGVDLRDLTDATREHIADMIRNGYIEGQIIQDEEADEPYCNHDPAALSDPEGILQCECGALVDPDTGRVQLRAAR